MTVRTLKKKPPLEKDFQRRVLKILREIPDSYWVRFNDRKTFGVPDILGCVKGRFFALELKRKKNGSYKATPLQRYHLKKIREAYGEAFILTPETLGQVLGILKTVSNIPKP